MQEFVIVSIECYTEAALSKRERDEEKAQKQHQMGIGSGMLPESYEKDMATIWKDVAVAAAHIAFIGPNFYSKEKAEIHFTSGETIVVKGSVRTVARIVSYGKGAGSEDDTSHKPFRELGPLVDDLVKRAGGAQTEK